MWWWAPSENDPDKTVHKQSQTIQWPCQNTDKILTYKDKSLTQFELRSSAETWLDRKVSHAWIHFPQSKLWCKLSWGVAVEGQDNYTSSWMFFNTYSMSKLGIRKLWSGLFIFKKFFKKLPHFYIIFQNVIFSFFYCIYSFLSDSKLPSNGCVTVQVNFGDFV